MTDAFVNVMVQPGAVASAAEEIAAVDAVDSVHVVTGEYDAVVQLDLTDHDDLPTVVAEEIHPVTGVVETVTQVAFEH
jgi:DNA-binding Lrp family transcriptional regulator